MANNLLRIQADRCRRLAEQAVKPEIKQGLLDMAADFERLAVELEARTEEQWKDSR